MKQQKEKNQTLRKLSSERGVLVLAVLSVFSLALFLLVLRFVTRPRPSAAVAKTQASKEASSTSTPRALLDGLPTLVASSRPVGVMIENHADARPLSGVAHASLVFEAPVEGGITRLLAFFDTSRDVGEIGPVRSARPYYLEWARELDALYAHVGGSPAALTALPKLGVHDLDQFFWDGYFRRSQKRVAPHNVYTSVSLLKQAVSDRLWDSIPQTTSWLFDERATGTMFFASEATTATTITVPFSSGSYKVVWKWDEEAKKYNRFVGGKAAIDADGEQESATTIAIVSVKMQVLDEKGRLALGVIGSGEAMVFQSGKTIRAEWRKANSKSRLTFYDTDGEEIVWRPGTTWVEVVPTTLSVTVE